MLSVHGYGSYIPRYRIERRTIAEQHGDHATDGETAVPAHDENSVTLGVNAAKNALSHADVAGAALDAVFVATTSDPFDVRGIAPHVAYALGANGDVRVGDFQGSARAATSALQAAADAVASESVETALVVATDVLTAESGTNAERTAGAGAAALVVGQDGEVGEIHAVAPNTTGFVGRFQRRGESPVHGDDRFNRDRGYLDAVTGAVERLGEEVDLAPTRAALPAPVDDWGDRALSQVAAEAQRHSSFDAIGDAGAASVLLDTALSLDAATPGEQLLVASYGPGGSDAFTLTTGAGVRREPEMTTSEYIESKEFVSYAKHHTYRERAGGDA